MRRSRSQGLLSACLGAVAVALAPAREHPAAAPLQPAKPPAKKADSAFELTVDSIMRGPGLVGYPPSALRWSGDSERLYFEWRPRGEDEPATWEVAALLPRAATAATAAGRRRPKAASRAGSPTTSASSPRRRAATGTRPIAASPASSTATSSSSIRSPARGRLSPAPRPPRPTRAGRTATAPSPSRAIRVSTACGSIATRRRTATAFEQLTDAGPAKPRPAADRQPAVPQERGGEAPGRRREAEAKKTKADARKDAQAVPRLTVGEKQTVEDLGARPRGEDCLRDRRGSSRRRRGGPTCPPTSRRRAIRRR